MIDLATRAAALWGVTEAPHLVSHRENAVFAVTLPDGRRAALRLHREGYRTADEIRSELIWAGALAQAGLNVPQPVPARDGALLRRVPGGPLASVTGWIDGAPVGDGDTPLGGDLAARQTFHVELGALLARLHDLSDRLDLGAEFTRPPWDRAALCGPDPAWGRCWEMPGLSEDQCEMLMIARAEAERCLSAHEARADIGLIHADALRENVFRTGDGLTLIDFDDSGVGFRLYDLACALAQSLDDPDLPAYAAALVSGYRSVRPLTAEAAELLPVFSMLRAFASAGWVVPRYPPGDPKWALYRDRALKAARAFLDGPPLYTV
jgi:Ser/Thr protein kinase RdoA (MazF antagonist)